MASGEEVGVKIPPVSVSGASGRSGGAGHCGVQPPEGVPAGGGAARQGETAEAERGEAQPAGGGAHPDHGANQPTGEHGRPASPQAEGRGKPRAAEGESWMMLVDENKQTNKEHCV